MVLKGKHTHWNHKLEETVFLPDPPQNLLSHWDRKIKSEVINQVPSLETNSSKSGKLKNLNEPPVSYGDIRGTI